MNILTIVKIAWRNLWRSKLRSSVVILSVIFGIVGGIIIIAMSYGLNTAVSYTHLTLPTMLMV